MTRRPLFLLLGALLFFPALLGAQATGVTITTWANRPTTCVTGQPFIFTDANATCTAGSGAIRWCICNATGNGFVPDPGGTPDPDSVGTSQLNDGVDTGLAGEWVQVDPGDTSQFNYRSDAELLTDTGAAPTASPTFTGDPTGPTATKGDSDTSLATTAFVDGEIRGWGNWTAEELVSDGTKCKPPSTVTINSGPKVWAIDCDDDAASVFYFDALLEEYEGGTLIFTLQAVNVNATPSGILDFDFSCQCRGDDDAVNSTWGTANNASITFATQYDLMLGQTAAHTPDGTCAAGDVLYCRAVMDNTATTTQVADVEILGVSAMEQ